MSELCKDGGTCHHGCEASCFREVHCSPLSNSNLDYNWEPLKLGDFDRLNEELTRTKSDLEEAKKLLERASTDTWCAIYNKDYTFIEKELPETIDNFLSNQPTKRGVNND